MKVLLALMALSTVCLCMHNEWHCKSHLQSRTVDGTVDIQSRRTEQHPWSSETSLAAGSNPKGSLRRANA